jgi:hypothetical protein
MSIISGLRKWNARILAIASFFTLIVLPVMRALRKKPEAKGNNSSSGKPIVDAEFAEVKEEKK